MSSSSTCCNALGNKILSGRGLFSGGLYISHNTLIFF